MVKTQQCKELKISITREGEKIQTMKSKLAAEQLCIGQLTMEGWKLPI